MMAVRSASSVEASSLWTLTAARALRQQETAEEQAGRSSRVAGHSPLVRCSHGRTSTEGGSRRRI